MPKNQDSLNSDLARQLKRYRPTMRNTSGKVVPVPEEAEVFQFHFVMDGEDYGTVTVSIDGLHKLVIYYSDSVEDSPNVSEDGDLTWTQLLLRLKNFAHQHQLSFELSDQDDLEGDMAKREHTKKLDEGYQAINKKVSVNDAVPTVKVRIQHTKDMQEGEQRFRHVAKIFIENAEGERILAPTNKPGIARVYARHIAEGGKPYDERWNHIGKIVEDYTKMAGFVRATRGGQFNESAQKLVTEGTNHYLKLRESLHKLSGHKGYNEYFESWSPPLMEDEINEDLSSMFMSSTLDPRIESVMPILSKLSKNITETTISEMDEFENWANEVVEGSLSPKTNAQLDSLVDILGQEKLTFGADAMNVKNELSDVIKDDNLFNMLSAKAEQDPDGDARKSVIDWLASQNNPEYKTILSKLQQSGEPVQEASKEEDEADYGDDYQEMVKRVGAKARAQEQAKKKPEQEQKTDESIGADQKAAGQLGPTEKVKNNNVGKLVGASESIDPVLSRIRKLSGL